MGSGDNNSLRASALPVPQASRLQSPKRHLTEITDSAHNARSTMLPPPPPGTKRKTLAERAGEPAYRNAPAPPQSNPFRKTVTGTSLVGASRQNSFSSSTSGVRPSSSSSYRSTSNSSFASTMSSGIRPPSAQSVRPHTGMSAHARSKSAYARPGTSVEEPSDANNVREGRAEEPSNSRTLSFFSASLNRKCSANTSRRKMPALEGVFSPLPLPSFPAGQATHKIPAKSLRDISISTEFNKLSLGPSPPVMFSPLQESNEPPTPSTPSLIPKKKPSVSRFCRPGSPSRSPRKTPTPVRYLTKDSNLKAIEWDLGSRVESVESMYHELKGALASTTTEGNGLKDTIALYKARINELDDSKCQKERENANLRRDLDSIRNEMSTQSLAMDEAKRKYSYEISLSHQTIQDAKRAHDNEIDDLQRKLRRDVNQAISDAEEEERRIERSHRDEVTNLKRKLDQAIEEEKEQRKKDIQILSSEGSIAQQKIEKELATKEEEILSMKDELEQSFGAIEREKESNQSLKAKLDETTNAATMTDSAMRSLKARIEFLESDCKSQSQSFAVMEQQTQNAIREAEEAKAKLRTEETLRRKLHNQVQELKGNIRVFCRVRPTLGEETNQARLTFPDASEDSKELEVFGQEEKSSLGTITTKKNAFSFDRVFSPTSQNAAVFDEISQLVQSALDGYNVCIFCYGQTGSGKTHTMSSEDGMIPRAVNQIYDTAHSLEEKGWKYTMEGSFVEVYNENINDLLGKAEDFDKKKHEIRHDMQRCKTTVTDINTVDLDSPGKVESVLRTAMNNRSVAATKANQRSSRSHSVFILKLNGENSITGEKSEGTLNLVDLAGSERLSHSGATGERLKETQNINKSLSCLGDVIGALGQGKDGGHIPYRNSKLTYLLQFSLGGNSKTLMFVMVSPLQAHLSETVTSLKFATKVHNTHIGTAKKQTKHRD